MQKHANKLGQDRLLENKRNRQRQWTTEKRAQQAKIINDNKPWLKSTGPKTSGGKARSCQNAMKHGFRSQFYRDIRRVLIKQSHYLRAVEAIYQQRKIHARLYAVQPWTARQSSGIFRKVVGLFKSSKVLFMKNISLMLLLGFVVSGCSTLKNGQMQEITIRTPGAENAKCYIENQDLKYMAYTDQTVLITKSPHDLVVNCKAAGNREKTVHVKREVDDWIFVNVANGFVPGAAYDYFSRGAFTYPDEVVVSFTGVPVKPYPLPGYMLDDVRQINDDNIGEYMGPAVISDKVNGKNPDRAPLAKREGLYGAPVKTPITAPAPISRGSSTSSRGGGNLDTLHRDYNPGYISTEEDK